MFRQKYACWDTNASFLLEKTLGGQKTIDHFLNNRLLFLLFFEILGVNAFQGGKSRFGVGASCPPVAESHSGFQEALPLERFSAINIPKVERFIGH